MAQTLEIVKKLNTEIINPLITLIFGLAFVLFLWGVFGFIRESDSDEGREVGKRNILWGLIGMVIMISAFGILKILAGTFGFDLNPVLENSPGF